MTAAPPSLGRKHVWPFLTISAILIATALLLRSTGRSWWCSCGQLFLWAGDICSAHNSQHLLDPYSFTHLLHGVALYWLLALVAPSWPTNWRLALATLLEALWEVGENSAYVIQRYREATAALGYQGDSVVNSLGDILCCIAGFLLAGRLGFRRSLALFLLVEALLIFWIRDSLILEVLMLSHPVEAIKAWQLCP